MRSCVRLLVCVLILITPCRVFAAIAVGQHAVNSVTSSASVTTPARNTATSGSSFLILVTYDQTFTSVADNKGNTIGAGQLVIAEDHATYFGGFPFYRGYLVTNGAGGTGHTFTLTTGSSGAASIFMVEITGGALSSLLDLVTTAIEDGSSPYTTNATGTLSQADELLVHFAMTNAAGTQTFTWGNGFTSVEEVTDGSQYWTAGVGQLVVSSTASVQGSLTLGSGSSARGMIIALKAPGGGGGGTVVNPISGKGGAAAQPVVH